MNPAYKETFSRHKILFSLPIVLAGIIALLVVLGAPKAYQAEASLWVDNPPPGPSWQDNNNPVAVSPATKTQNLLNELLATRRFRLAVGQAGGLTKYLAAHSSAGFGPGALLQALRGKEPLDNRVVSSLDAKHVLSTAQPGGQLLALSLKGPDPVVAANTLSALLQQLKLERSKLVIQREEDTVTFFQSQVDAAQAALTAAATPQAASVASTRLASMTKLLNQTRINLGVAKHPNGSFKIVDPPTPPAGPVSGKKKALMGLVGGLFVGALLSFLGIVLLSGREQRRVVEPPAEAPVEEPAVVQEEPAHEPSYDSNVEWLPTNSGLEYHAPGNGSNGSNGSNGGSQEAEKPASHADQGRD